MARLVNVASVLFSTRAQRGAKDAEKIVLEETGRDLESLKGYGLDLVVLSEGVGDVGQTPETAEEIENPGPFLKLFSKFAASENCHVAGCVKTREGDHAYNSII